MSSPTAEPPRLYKYPFKLLRTIDGDTFRVRQDKGNDIFFEINLRLLGCDAPETHRVKQRAAGNAVSAAVNLLLARSTGLHCTSVKWDKYGGRVDGDIELIPPWQKRPLWLSKLMLNRGMAKAFTGKGKRGWSQAELKKALGSATTLVLALYSRDY